MKYKGYTAGEDLKTGDMLELDTATGIMKRVEIAVNTIEDVSSGPSYAQICPVCKGNGLVDAGFYDHPGTAESWTTSTATPEPCRSCQGKGWIVVNEKFILEVN